MIKYRPITDEQLDFLRSKNVPKDLIDIVISYMPDMVYIRDINYATSKGIAFWYKEEKDLFKVILNADWSDNPPNIDVELLDEYAGSGTLDECADIKTLSTFLTKNGNL